MPFVQRGQQKLYYQEEGQGQPVILINDLIEDHLFWSVIQSKLSEQFRVITFDQRGTGQSSIPKEVVSIEDLAEDVIAIADELNIEKFHLIGDSIGGIVAQLVSRKFTDRVDRLILSNSMTHLSQVNRWSIEIACDFYKDQIHYDELYKLFMPWYFSSRFLEREDDPKELLNGLKKRKHPLTYKGLQKIVEPFLSYDSTKNLKYIQAPTLVIIAEEDIFCLFRDSRAMVKAIPTHQVELISGGHNSKLEHPNRWAEVVLNFFNS